MKTFFKHYFFLLDDEAKKCLPVLIFFFVCSSLLDVIGIGTIGVFLLLIVNFSQMIQKFPIFFQQISMHFGKNEFISLIGIVLILIFLLKGFFGVYTQKKMVLIASKFSARLKTRLMTAYQNAAYSFHIKQNSAYLINKISWADNFSVNALSTSLNILSSLLITLCVTLSLAVTYPIVTLFLMIMIGFIFISYEIFLKNHVVRIGKTMAFFSGEINKSILQALGGFKEIRVLGCESFFLSRLKMAALSQAQTNANYNSLQLIPRYVVESFAAIFLVLLILVALLMKANPINMIPTLGVFAAASIRLLPTVSQLIAQLSQIRSSHYVAELLCEEITLLAGKYRTSLIENDMKSRQPFSQIMLQKIIFCYPAAKKNALLGVTLTLFRGQSIGLIGASGAGKSTLVNIILGLLTPDSGYILVDGKPIHTLRAWLNNFAYIPQSIFLLDDTLKRNIAMGIEDNEIDNQKLKTAIEMAQLSSVVSDLPDGVDTLIGENGVRLSGGQRQRVALARALYYEREIIVMDEATSSLDNETEREVINSIKRLHGVKTLIVIAHRLTTIQYCDRVYRLEKGEIVAQGSFKEVVGREYTEKTPAISHEISSKE